MNDEYLSQTDLGKRFGVSSHLIGKWLIEVGLRTEEKRPSQRAFDGGFVKQVPTGRNEGYFYVWQAEATIKMLIEGGRKPLSDSQEAGESILRGQFQVRSSEEDHNEITDSTGAGGVWVRGEKNTQAILKLMNLAWKQKVFFC